MKRLFSFSITSTFTFILSLLAILVIVVSVPGVVQAEPPGAPPLSSPANGANVSGTSVTFSWTAPSGTGIDGYYLRVNTNSSFTGTDIYSGAVGYVGSKTVSGFPNTGVTYYWYVLAHNASGWGPASSTRNFINGWAGYFQGDVYITGNVGIGTAPDTGATLKAYSATGNAIYGNSDSTGTGVAGTRIDGMGIYGTSTSNTGVYGGSNTGNAGYFVGRVYVGGSLSTAYTKKAAAYTVTANDSIIAVDSTSGSFAIALPSAIGIAGREYTVKKVDNSGLWVSVACTGADTIDGQPFKLLSTQYAYLIVVSDGYNWMIVGQSP